MGGELSEKMLDSICGGMRRALGEERGGGCSTEELFGGFEGGC